jgi:hypothetical protein
MDLVASGSITVQARPAAATRPPRSPQSMLSRWRFCMGRAGAPSGPARPGSGPLNGRGRQVVEFGESLRALNIHTDDAVAAALAAKLDADGDGKLAARPAAPARDAMPSATVAPEPPDPPPPRRHRELRGARGLPQRGAPPRPARRGLSSQHALRHA